jgi:hypothetical protein
MKEELNMVNINEISTGGKCLAPLKKRYDIFLRRVYVHQQFDSSCP